MDADKIRKNGYHFSYAHREQDWLGRVYLPKESLEASLGQELGHQGTELVLASKSQDLKQVLATTRLIAHAGGTML